MAMRKHQGVAMDYIELQGVRLPALGFGTMRLTGDDGVTAIRRALDIGYRHLDTVANYGNETEVGQAIRESGVSRDDIFLTTKVARDNLAPDDLPRSVDESLRKLAVDYVDLLLIHWPNAEIPLGDCLPALEQIKAAGKARAIGVANFPTAMLEESIAEHEAPLLCDQVEYHPFLSQNRVLEFLRAHEMMLTAYCPLARGAAKDDPTLQAIGTSHGKTSSQVALRWLLDQQNVAAIPKAVSEQHARETFDVFDFVLNTAETARIDALADNRRIVSPALAPSWDAA